jgi:hypothetical protein
MLLPPSKVMPPLPDQRATNTKQPIHPLVAAVILQVTLVSPPWALI